MRRVHIYIKKKLIPRSPNVASTLILKRKLCTIKNSYITRLFSKSLTQARIHHAWSRKNKTHIHKKVDKKQAVNYRPISLSFLIKLIEKIIRDQMVALLDTKKPTTENQYIFHCNRCCLSVGMSGSRMMWFTWIVKKTFKIPHNRLLSKLEIHGIRDHLLAWIGKWLSERQ